MAKSDNAFELIRSLAALRSALTATGDAKLLALFKEVEGRAISLSHDYVEIERDHIEPVDENGDLKKYKLT